MEGVRTRSRAKQEGTTPEKAANGRLQDTPYDEVGDRGSAENIFVFWPNLIGIPSLARLLA